MQKSSSETYAPAEDTFFLADHIQNEGGYAALEVGTGSGYLAGILEKKFEIVVGTDIDFGALQGQQTKTKNRVCCQGADALKEKFDLVVCNLPYLPSDEISDITVDGGPEGLLVPLRIVDSAAGCVRAGGRMLLLTSSLANYEKLANEIESRGFDVRILGKKKMFFEELVLLESTRR